jgi:hypothetical protein
MACSFSVRVPAIASERIPLRKAKEHECAVQYAQADLLEAHIASPIAVLKDLLPKSVAGKLNIFGTSKL